LPPIGDPVLFERFSETHVNGERPQDWQSLEHYGDAVHRLAIQTLMMETPFVRKCVTFLERWIWVNEYQKTLTEKLSLCDLCSGQKSEKKSSTFKAKALADIVEVDPALFPSLFKVFWISLNRRC